MSLSSMSMGKYDTLQVISEVGLAASVKLDLDRDGFPELVTGAQNSSLAEVRVWF